MIASFQRIFLNKELPDYSQDHCSCRFCRPVQHLLQSRLLESSSFNIKLPASVDRAAATFFLSLSTQLYHVDLAFSFLMYHFVPALFLLLDQD